MSLQIIAEPNDYGIRFKLTMINSNDIYSCSFLFPWLNIDGDIKKDKIERMIKCVCREILDNITLQFSTSGNRGHTYFSVFPHTDTFEITHGTGEGVFESCFTFELNKNDHRQLIVEMLNLMLKYY